MPPALEAQTLTTDYQRNPQINLQCGIIVVFKSGCTTQSLGKLKTDKKACLPPRPIKSESLGQGLLAFLKSSEVILMQSRLKATVREERTGRRGITSFLHILSLPPILYPPLSCPFPVVIH